jgi:hypothetical protein
MKNVTITLDEDTAAWARVEAARADKSLSRFIGEMLQERMRKNDAYEAAMRSWLARKPTQLRADGERWPTRDELYDRPILRRY